MDAGKGQVGLDSQRNHRRSDTLLRRLVLTHLDWHTDFRRRMAPPNVDILLDLAKKK
jgi:hypothetical protein